MASAPTPAETSSVPSESVLRSRRFLVTLLCTVSLMCLVFYLTAWLSDDSYIDFRVVDNIVSGRGPVWNVGERVQVFTSPLWVGLLSLLCYATRLTPPVAAFCASLACHILLLFIAALIGIHRPKAFKLVLLTLFCSQAFIDYSSGGLENPLLHLIAASICLVLWLAPELGEFKTLLALSVLGGLALCARVDTLFVVAPVLIYLIITSRRTLKLGRTFATVLAGMSSFVAWEVFSIVYYGSFVPNTALAKLPIGYPRAELLHKGVWLIEASAVADPVTVIAIVAFPVALWAMHSRLWLPSMLASLGTLVYITLVGGDFMLGRFLSFIFVFSCFALLVGVGEGDLSMPRWSARALIVPAVVIFTSIAALVGFHTYIAEHKFSANYPSTFFYKSQVADERSYYSWTNGLRNMLSGKKNRWLIAGEELRESLGDRRALVAKNNIGMFGYSVGPNVYIVDPYGIADPYLSRLPSCPERRAGHYLRAMPAGYLASLVDGRNWVGDPFLARLLDDTMLASRGPLFTRNRLHAIWRLNSGAYSDPAAASRYLRVPGGVRNVLPGYEAVPCPPALDKPPFLIGDIRKSDTDLTHWDSSPVRK